MTSLSSAIARRMVPLGLVTAIGCADPSSAAVGDTASALGSPSIIDLISPATCTQQLNKLRNCVIPTQTFSAAAVETAVPRRTVVTRTKTGNCSTTFPVQLALTPNLGAPLSFLYLSQDQITVRGPNGAALSSLQVADSSPWTPSLVVDKTCRVSLTVQLNAIDIDSPDQARALIAELEARLAAKRAERERYSELITFSAAYDLMHSLAQSFHAELSNDGMQRLRASAVRARPGLRLAFDSCSSIGAEDGDRLFELYEALVVLGEADADGRPRTIAEILGSDAAAVYETVTRLEAATSPGIQERYADALRVATTELTTLEASLELAKIELAPWLGE